MRVIPEDRLRNLADKLWGYDLSYATMCDVLSSFLVDLPELGEALTDDQKRVVHDAAYRDYQTPVSERHHLAAALSAIRLAPAKTEQTATTMPPILPLPHLRPDGFWRHADLLLMTAEERAIFELVQRVEALGAHPLLTEVVTLLGNARYKLADWLEQPGYQPATARAEPKPTSAELLSKVRGIFADEAARDRFGTGYVNAIRTGNRSMFDVTRVILAAIDKIMPLLAATHTDEEYQSLLEQASIWEAKALKQEELVGEKQATIDQLRHDVESQGACCKERYEQIESLKAQLAKLDQYREYRRAIHVIQDECLKVDPDIWLGGTTCVGAVKKIVATVLTLREQLAARPTGKLTEDHICEVNRILDQRHILRSVRQEQALAYLRYITVVAAQPEQQAAPRDLDAELTSILRTTQFSVSIEPGECWEVYAASSDEPCSSGHGIESLLVKLRKLAKPKSEADIDREVLAAFDEWNRIEPGVVSKEEQALRDRFAAKIEKDGAK